VSQGSDLIGVTNLVGNSTTTIGAAAYAIGVAGRNLHRNNAAEWVMWVVLLPLVPIVWLFDRLAKVKSSRD
jgi:hypothetical protein